jgi:hypothetical protein
VGTQMLRRSMTGSGLIETLVALLLLSVTLLGTASTLVRTISSSRSAALHTRAVDLAADLAEELRAQPIDVNSITTSPLLADWRARVAAALPVANLSPAEYADVASPVASPSPAPVQLHTALRWHHSALGQLDTLQVPLTVAASATP